PRENTAAASDDPLSPAITQLPALGHEIAAGAQLTATGVLHFPYEKLSTTLAPEPPPPMTPQKVVVGQLTAPGKKLSDSDFVTLPLLIVSRTPPERPAPTA